MNDQQKKTIERKSVRKQLLFYDLLILLVSTAMTYVLQTPQGRAVFPKTVLLHLPLLAVCLFVFRSLFRVYYQILRYGYVRVYARTFAADVLAGIASFVLLWITQHTLLKGNSAHYRALFTLFAVNFVLTFFPALYITISMHLQSNRRALAAC